MNYSFGGHTLLSGVSLCHGLCSDTNVTSHYGRTVCQYQSARIFIFKVSKSSQRSYTTGSCSQMPGASSSALLGDIMLINIQKVV